MFLLFLLVLVLVLVFLFVQHLCWVRATRYAACEKEQFHCCSTSADPIAFFVKQ